jgi:hypothetical protein
MDRKHLYHIYAKHQQSAYFKPYLEPKLQRYIDRRIPTDSLPSEVIEWVQQLVEEVRGLPIERKNYTEIQQYQSGAITALLGYTLFAKRRVRLDRNLHHLQRHFPEVDWDDICQFSLVIVSNPAKFLQNFQAQPDWYESFCRYSENKFPKSLIDELRRIAGNNFQRTNLGLLVRTSPTQITTIITEQFNKDGVDFSRLMLLHQCFQETVKAGIFITKAPKPEHYDALLARYRSLNTERNLDIIDRTEVTKLLEILSNSTRNFYQPTGGARSLDEVAYAGDKFTSEVTIGDLQAAPVLISLEDAQKRELVLELLLQDLPKSDATTTESDRKLVKARSIDLQLFLTYGLDLDRTEVGKELDLPQYTISRQVLGKIAMLAKELYLRDENLPPIKQIPAEILNGYIDYVEPLCADYYARLAIDLLAETIASTTTASIVERFIETIETRWQMQFKPDGGGLSKVYAFIRRQQQHGNWDDESKIHKSLRVPS